MTEEWIKSNMKKYMPEIGLFTFGNVFYGRFIGQSDIAIIRYIKSKKELTLPFDINLNDDNEIIPINKENEYTNGWDEDLLFYEESNEVIKQMLKLHKRYKELMCNIKKNELEKDFE